MKVKEHKKRRAKQRGKKFQKFQTERNQRDARWGINPKRSVIDDIKDAMKVIRGGMGWKR